MANTENIANQRGKFKRNIFLPNCCFCF